MENTITKEDVLAAFACKRRQRNYLLYQHYQPYFQQPFTASYIAGKISQDLGIVITSHIIRHIRARIHKPLSSHQSLSNHPENVQVKQAEVMPLQQPLVGSVVTKQTQVKQTEETPFPPTLSLQELEAFVQKGSLSVGDLENMLALESTPAKRIVLLEKIKQLRQLQAYDQTSKKSIFD